MGKESTSTSKKRFFQTQLNFTPQRTSDLENGIDQLRISKPVDIDQRHPQTCPRDHGCTPDAQKIACSALNPETGNPCHLVYCSVCVELERKDDCELTQTICIQDTIPQNHYKSIWKCAVCRGLCMCDFCRQSPSPLPHVRSVPSRSKVEQRQRESQNLDVNGPSIEPVKLKPISLLYSEDELWLRLQIREFVFHFNNVLNPDPRLIMRLQNLQGDWRVKRLTAHLSWRALTVMAQSGTGVYGSHTQQPLQRMASKLINQWIKEANLDQPINESSRRAAFEQVLEQEGMTGRHWQDIAELLSVAGFNDLPVPTTSCIGKEDKDIQQQIDEFRCKRRKALPLSSRDELWMIQCLLEVLLLDTRARQLLDSSKELKILEEQLSEARKLYNLEDLRARTQRNNLANNIAMMRSVGSDASQLEMELDTLETKLRDGRMTMETRELEYMIAKRRNRKRFDKAGIDTLSNEYWIFNDILAPLELREQMLRNSEPCWAYGVIVIGPGYGANASKNGERQWWCVNGIDQIQKLDKWLARSATPDMAHLRQELSVRLRYLRAVEWVVFGEGYFSGQQ